MCSLSVQNIHSQNYELWGTTSEGGKYGGGTIFKTNAIDDYFSVEHSFYVENRGAHPISGHLTEGTNGKLYGLTSGGGIYNKGVLFEYDPQDNTYVVKVDFEGSNGDDAFGGLMLASNGVMYGVTRNGGKSNSGVLFKYIYTDNQFVQLLDFSDYGALSPENPPIEASNGKFYGVTSEAFFEGKIENGTLYEFDPNTYNFEVKIIFDNADKGSKPMAKLIQATNGKLYGTTFSGGINEKGVLFEYDLEAELYNKKIDFGGELYGATPDAGVEEFTTGQLFGITRSGGLNDDGVLYRYDLATNEFVKLIDLERQESGGGASVNMIRTVNGDYFGVTRYGGTNGEGVLFQYDLTNNSLTKKVDFNIDIHGGLPTSLMEASSGKIYGMTYRGGKGGRGSIYKYDPLTEVFSKEIDLNIMSREGGFPESSLIRGSNNKFYGMTRSGGVNSYATLFEYDQETKDIKKLHDFDGPFSGSGLLRVAYLMKASNGKLYGSTRAGGELDRGVIFEYDTEISQLTSLLSLGSNLTNTSTPIGKLAENQEGKLYGTTHFGGENDHGIIFEYDLITNKLSKKAEFHIDNTGYKPNGLIAATNGKLYGTNKRGGGNGHGTFFEFDPKNSELNKIIDFNRDVNGSSPAGGLVEHSNNKIYGVTTSGELFEYDPDTEILIKKVETESGRQPIGGLSLSTNGLIYGTMAFGGNYDGGLLFSYNPTLTELKVEKHFRAIHGQSPFGSLLFVEVNKLDQSVSLEELPEKTYGEDPFSPTVITTSDLSTIVSSSEESIAISSSNEISIVGAGTTNITATQEGNDQYNPASSKSQELIVNKAPLTISAENQEMRSNQPLPDLTMSFSGLVNNDTEVDLTLPIISTVATDNSEIGDYEILLTGGESSNYNITLANGVLSIVEILGIIDYENNSISTYPNPTKQSFRIKGNKHQFQQVLIYDLNGGLVREFDNSEAIYDISSLKKGFYSLVIKSQDITYRSKLIKN